VVAVVVAVQNYNDAKAYYEKLIAKQTQDVPFDMPRERYVDDIASNKGAEQPTSAAPTSTQPRLVTNAARTGIRWLIVDV
jgi:hypothetical protein